MANEASKNRRIAKNAALLYFRMLLLIAVNLYTSRVILAALGVDDYAVYTTVGGLVTLFAVLSGTLSAAISRFIVYELGKNNSERLQHIFSTSLIIQMAMVVVAVLVGETLGLWYVNSVMQCPPERLAAANWCFQFSLLSFCVNLLSIPYNAEIIAHERMSAFAYISIIEAVGNLGIAFMVSFTHSDRLVLYAVLMFFLALVVRLCYTFYCNRHFKECHFRWHLDLPLLKEMMAFAGWNLIGAAAGVIREQGGLLLVNALASLVVNAAMGLSMKVSAVATKFVQNIMVALNPQITKSYADGNHSYMFNLVFQGARISFYVLLCLALPIIFNTQPLLDIWLHDVPAHTANFVRLILVLMLSESLSLPLITIMLATGNIRNYQLIVGGLQLLNIPISYLCLSLGAIPESVTLVAIVLSQCSLVARLILLRRMVALDIRSYLHKVYLNVILVTLVASTIAWAANSLMAYGYLRLLVMSPVILAIVLATEFYVGCTSSERAMVLQKVRAFSERRTKHG